MYGRRRRDQESIESAGSVCGTDWKGTGSQTATFYHRLSVERKERDADLRTSRFEVYTIIYLPQP